MQTAVLRRLASTVSKKHRLFLLGTALTFLPSLAWSNSSAFYRNVADRVVTIETRDIESKVERGLGSGYLVKAPNIFATNFHVIDALLENPQKNEIVAKKEDKIWSTKVLQFDYVNDLALLEVQNYSGRPLRMAFTSPRGEGQRLWSIGNIYGLGVSIVEGIFNGYPKDSLIDRMMISSPINSGMSGGPILNSYRQVLGTNVSHLSEGDDASFGVPLEPLKNLLEKPRLKDFSAEGFDVLRSQVDLFSRHFEEGFVLSTPYESKIGKLGGLTVPEFPPFLNCGSPDSTTSNEIEESMIRCQPWDFPSFGSLNNFPTVRFTVKHYRNLGAPRLSLLAKVNQESRVYAKTYISPRRTKEDAASPECSSQRLRKDETVWFTNLCVRAIKNFPNLFHFAATMHSGKDRERALVSMELFGFRKTSFVKIFAKLSDTLLWAEDLSKLKGSLR